MEFKTVLFFAFLISLAAASPVARKMEHEGGIPIRRFDDDDLWRMPTSFLKTDKNTQLKENKQEVEGEKKNDGKIHVYVKVEEQQANKEQKQEDKKKMAITDPTPVDHPKEGKNKSVKLDPNIFGIKDNKTNNEEDKKHKPKLDDVLQLERDEQLEVEYLDAEVKSHKNMLAQIEEHYRHHKHNQIRYPLGVLIPYSNPKKIQTNKLE